MTTTLYHVRLPGIFGRTPELFETKVLKETDQFYMVDRNNPITFCSRIPKRLLKRERIGLTVSEAWAMARAFELRTIEEAERTLEAAKRSLEVIRTEEAAITLASAAQAAV